MIQIAALVCAGLYTVCALGYAEEDGNINGAAEKVRDNRAATASVVCSIVAVGCFTLFGVFIKEST